MEHTSYSPANFLGDRRHRRHNLRHCPESPSPEGEVLLPGVWYVVSRVPVSRVAHSFDVECGAGLTVRLDRQRGDFNTCEACLVVNESHLSRMTEKFPLSLHVGIVICYDVQTLLGSLTASSYDPSSAA